MSYVTSDGCRLYYEDAGEGVPILLIHPAGATASTWGAAVDELAEIGQVITYDRRGYARSSGEAVRSMAVHTADAVALLGHLCTPPAIVVGTSAGAAIGVDLAVRRPELVRAVIAHEFPWRFARHLPTAAQIAALANIASLALLGRRSDAAETLLRSAYTYGAGGSAWDAFPPEWRQAGRDNARSALADFRNSIGTYPSAAELATITVPIVCSYGARSPQSMVRLVRSLAAAIPTAQTRRVEGAGHAAPFDAPGNFVELVAEAINRRRDTGTPANGPGGSTSWSAYKDAPSYSACLGASRSRLRPSARNRMFGPMSVCKAGATQAFPLTSDEFGSRH